MEHPVQAREGLSAITIKEEPADGTDDDDDSVSSLPLPVIIENITPTGNPDNEFLRLTTMVRSVYLNHLHRSLINNYVNCCMKNEENVLHSELKRCAGEMELDAVRASLEASLYQKAMVKMISEVKSRTSLKKTHERLVLFLNAPPKRIDIGVQTEEIVLDEKIRIPDTTCDYGNDYPVQNLLVTSAYDDSALASARAAASLDKRLSKLLKSENRPFHERTLTSGRNWKPADQSPSETIDLKLKSESSFQCDRKPETQSFADLEEIFGMEDAATIRADDDASQDSILQHLEDMFCGSDDSSDLTALIEKHSGVTKANVDMEIGKLCPETNNKAGPIEQSTLPRKDNTGETSTLHTNKRKLSYTSYRRMKNHEKGEPDPVDEEDMLEEQKKRRSNRVWFVERINQVAKLEAKMAEISLKDYRKHGRIKAKFLELFGEADEDEMMPRSPICIEEHLNACKERIAPWVVRHLMPYYKRKRILDRKLFKSVAKHVTDKLIIENTFPEEEDVKKYVDIYFRNKRTIKIRPDIYI